MDPQGKKEMERATRRKRKTNVTIFMVNLLELVPPKVKLVGFHVGFRCGFDDHTRGTQRVDGGEPDQGEHTGRQNVTSPDSAQKRPNGTFSLFTCSKICFPIPPQGRGIPF